MGPRELWFRHHHGTTLRSVGRRHDNRLFHPGPGHAGVLCDRDRSRRRAQPGGLLERYDLRFGAGANGRLGNATTLDADTPTTVVSFDTTPGGLSADCDHALALKSGGTLWAFGYNGFGQLGSNATTDISSPVEVSGLTGVVAVSAGYNFSVALRSDGTQWSWGDNTWGILGSATPPEATTPRQVPGISAVIVISVGDNDVLALRSDGTVWAWGSDAHVQLGHLTSLGREQGGRA